MFESTLGFRKDFIGDVVEKFALQDKRYKPYQQQRNDRSHGNPSIAEIILAIALHFQENRDQRIFSVFWYTIFIIAFSIKLNVEPDFHIHISNFQ